MYFFGAETFRNRDFGNFRIFLEAGCTFWEQKPFLNQNNFGQMVA